MQWVRGPLGHRSVTVLLSRYFAAAESYNLGHFFSALLRSISSAVKEMLIPAGRAKDMRRVRQGSFRRWPPRTNEVSQNIVPPAQVQGGQIPGSFVMLVVLYSVSRYLVGADVTPYGVKMLSICDTT